MFHVNHMCLNARDIFPLERQQEFGYAAAKDGQPPEPMTSPVLILIATMEHTQRLLCSAQSLIVRRL